MPDDFNYFMQVTLPIEVISFSDIQIGHTNNSDIDRSLAAVFVHDDRRIDLGHDPYGLERKIFFQSNEESSCAIGSLSRSTEAQTSRIAVDEPLRLEFV